MPRAHEIKPIWTTSSFLVYTGGLTVLVGAASGLVYLSTQYGGFGRAAWALLFLVILYAVAIALLLRDRPVAAGIFAFVSVIAWSITVALFFNWFGWHVTRSLSDFSLARLVLWLLILLSASVDRRLFRFPFIRLISAVVLWLFIIDLLRADHGNWFAVVTLFVGLSYLSWGTVHRTPSSFWLHLVGGALIGVSILHWFHTSDFDYAVVSVVSFFYVLVAYVAKRSSWAFWGTVGFFAATSHYLVGSATGLATGVVGAGSGGTCTSTATGTVCTSAPSGVSGWAPALAFGLLGFFLVLLGMIGRRRHHDHHHAAVVTPAPVAPPAAAVE